jgi:hypothetical protein
MDTPKAHLSTVRGQSIRDGERGEAKRVGGCKQSVPRTGGQGDVGTKMEERTNSRGAPAHSQPCRPACEPPSPSPLAHGAARVTQYLRMVCVMEVWRCSTGRRGSWCGEGTRTVSAGILTLRRKAWRLRGWARGSW